MSRLFRKPSKEMQMIATLGQCKLQHHIARCEAVRVEWWGPCGGTGPRSQKTAVRLRFCLFLI